MNNIPSHLKSNDKMFWNYINSKTKFRPSISDSFIDEKAGVKAENFFEMAEALGRFSSAVYYGAGLDLDPLGRGKI